MAAKDWSVADYAAEHGYVLVTNDRTDFTRLMAQRSNHAGLICVNVAHGRNSREVQRTMFGHALDQIDAEQLPGNTFDVTLDADGTVRITCLLSP